MIERVFEATRLRAAPTIVYLTMLWLGIRAQTHPEKKGGFLLVYGRYCLITTGKL